MRLTCRGVDTLREVKWDKGEQEEFGDGATSRFRKAFRLGYVGNARERKLSGGKHK